MEQTQSYYGLLIFVIYLNCNHNSCLGTLNKRTMPIGWNAIQQRMLS